MKGKNFTPFPVLETDRLLLRQLAGSDDQAIYALRSNPLVNQYLNRKPSETIDDARAFIRAIHENTRRNDSIYWAISLKGADDLIGTICLFEFSSDHSKAEIGYELLPAFQGKEIMHEAALKVVRFGMKDLGLTLIEAQTHVDNLGSIRLLEKLNFKWQGAGEDNSWLFVLKPGR